MNRVPLWMAIVFVLHAMPTQSQEPDPALNKLEGETLLETSPSSVGVANFVLTTTFDRGVEDIGGYTLMMKVLIQHALNLATDHPEHAAEYKSQLLPITYNLATNTWPGWGEGEVSPDINERHQAIGMEAAHLNVKVAEELNAPPQRRKNGYWALGIHQIAAGNYTEATQTLARSRDLADEAGIEDAKLMAQGWIHFANILAGQDESSSLDEVEKKLRSMGADGEYYANQYDVAMQVFRPSKQQLSGPPHA